MSMKDDLAHMEEDGAAGLGYAIKSAHHWLEEVERGRRNFGLDHKIGENNDGCNLCGAVRDQAALIRMVRLMAQRIRDMRGVPPDPKWYDEEIDELWAKAKLG